MIKPAFLALALALTLAAALPASAQQPLRLQGLDKLARKAAQVSRVSLDGDMLRAAASGRADAGARQVLDHLKGVYIRDLEFKKPGEYPQSAVDRLAAQLSEPRWHIIVQTRDGNERTWIAVQRDREVITSLAVVDAEPRELTVINIIGPLPRGLASLSALSALGGGIGKLGKLGKLGKVDGSAPAARPELQTRNH